MTEKFVQERKTGRVFFNDGMIYHELIEITGLSSRKSMENTSYQIRKAVEKKLEVEQFIDGYQDYGYWINPIWWCLLEKVRAFTEKTLTLISENSSRPPDVGDTNELPCLIIFNLLSFNFLIL
ncbi:MAG TPA: hypothetical protein PL121_02225 [bacterium]|nr:hypothetical protein [bacterium]HRT11005.1 hypothetical protein [Patescibacteria group bacterium]HRU89704.1 hypothetical protein [Patescibacteria group bacterium]